MDLKNFALAIILLTIIHSIIAGTVTIQYGNDVVTDCEMTNWLDEGIKVPGKYRMIWDGKDEFGNAVSSGLYIYRLKTESFSISQKMFLLK
jgi:hypothetical protein